MKKLEKLIFTAIGEASMCWSETPKGVFDSNKAAEIGEKLISDIKALSNLDEDDVEYLCTEEDENLILLPLIKEWPESSMIAKTEYKDYCLLVTFKNGKTYTYLDYPESEWESLVKAQSIGKFINSEVKGKYSLK